MASAVVLAACHPVRLRWSREDICSKIAEAMLRGYGHRSVSVDKCPGCGQESQDAVGLPVTPTDHAWLVRAGPYDRKKPGYVVSMPCCGWTGWVQRQYRTGAHCAVTAPHKVIEAESQQETEP